MKKDFLQQLQQAIIITFIILSATGSRAQDVFRKLTAGCATSSDCFDIGVPRPFVINNKGNITESVFSIRFNSCKLVPYQVRGYRGKEEVEFLPENLVAYDNVRRIDNYKLRPSDDIVFWNRPTWGCGRISLLLVDLQDKILHWRW